MADNSFKINKSVNFNPQAGAPANPIDGDFFYDSVAQSFAYYHNGSWANFDSVGTVGTALWLTGAQFTPAVVRNSVVKVTGGVSTAHLAGISASFSAKRITIYNAGSALIVVEPEDANEPTANNRIQTPTGGSMNLIAGEVAVFTYDIVANRWLLVSISSQAGAQVIATTTNPGIVTLHQASLFPLDGIVLSDGDLNTANGVIGLDSNRAATIAAPLAAVSALTITGNAGAVALTLNQGSSSTAPVFTTKIASTSGEPHYRWYDDLNNPQGYIASNGDINLLATSQKLAWPNDTYITSGSTGSITAWLGTGTESIQFNGENGLRTSLILSTDGGPTITLRSEVSAVAAQLRIGSAYPLDFYINSVSRWRIAATGELQAQGANRAIQNVLNPVSAQDVATMDYVDVYRTPTNYVHNGRFDFWQRGANITTTGTRKFTADRWSIVCGSTTGNVIVYQSGSAPDHCRYSVAVNRPDLDSGTNARFFTQEIDRDSVRLLRGKKVQLVFWAKKGAQYSGSLDALNVVVATGTVEAGIYAPSGYTGSALPINTAVTLTTTWQKFTAHAIAAVGTTAAAMAVAFSYSPVGTASGADDSFYIAGVQLVDESTISGANAPNPTETFIYAGGSYATDLRECQRYYEKSYAINVNPGTNTPLGAETSGHAASAVNNTTRWHLTHPRFKVPKRIVPTTVTIWSVTSFTEGKWEVPAGTDRTTIVSNISTNGFELVNNEGGQVTPTAGVATGHWAADAEL